MDKKNDQKTLKACLRMVALLKERGRMKAPELAKELGLNNMRSIYYYKNILKTLGYQIVTFGGYQGGYEIKKGVEKLSNDELDYLKIQLSHDNFGQMKLSEKNKNLIQKIIEINNNIK